MASLAGLSLLVVEDHEDSREMLEVFLSGEGARVTAVGTAAEARAAIARHCPDVLLTDVTLPDQDGLAFLAALRAEPATRQVPAIALTGLADPASRRRVDAAGFQKVLTKPLDFFALTAAIISVAAVTSDPSDGDSEALVRCFAADHNMRGLLAVLNAATPYRYTSILRFSGDTLDSVWTFNREKPGVDSFPADTAIESSYCSFVRATGTPFHMTDAATDERVALHPKRLQLRAYCGVPLARPDGSLFGTLCHYDAAPKVVVDETLIAMTRVAQLLAPYLGRGVRSESPV